MLAPATMTYEALCPAIGTANCTGSGLLSVAMFEGRLGGATPILGVTKLGDVGELRDLFHGGLPRRRVVHAAFQTSEARLARNLLEAARRNGIERFVYTSTVGCIGVPHGGVGDETVRAEAGFA